MRILCELQSCKTNVKDIKQYHIKSKNGIITVIIIVDRYIGPIPVIRLIDN